MFHLIYVDIFKSFMVRMYLCISCVIFIKFYKFLPKTLETGLESRMCSYVLHAHDSTIVSVKQINTSGS